VGSYDTVAKSLANMVNEGELDGIMLIVPDFVDDLKKASSEVFTRMQQHGVMCGPGQP
jgi:pyrimidine oxygenase